jgi:16S rRNA processing protein RimM
MLLAGEAGKPHGLAGDVYVVPISDDPRRFQAGSVLLRVDGTELVVESARRHADRFLVKFSGIESRDAAALLRGPLYVSAADVRTLGEDEFWPHDLEGCEVVDVTGAVVGAVRAVIPGSAQDLLAVDTAAGERLVPLVKEIVVAVDVAGRRVTIDPPPGLLD